MRTHQARLSKITLIVALIGFAVQGLNAQERYEFSVMQAVDFARKNSVIVKNALLTISRQTQENRATTAAALPQVNGSVNVQKNINLPVSLVPGEFFGDPPGTYRAFPFGTEYNGTYGVTLEQLLFDGQVFVGLQARRASIDWRTAEAQVTEEMIKANVYKIYYQLVVGQKQISTFDANITRTEKLLTDTRALFQNGFAEKLDVDKVTVNLANLRTEKTKMENNIKTGYIGLKYLMGMPVKSELVLTDSISDEMVKQDLLVDSVRYEDRKEFQVIESLEKLAKFDIKRYQFMYLPTVSVTGNYSRNAQRNSFDFFKGNRDWFTITYVGLNINVPIFDGFRKDAQIKAARITLQQTQNTKDDLKNKIDQEVDSAVITIRNAIITLDAQRQNMELANEVYNQTKVKYDNGLGSNLEISNAEADLRIAQNNYYQALNDAIVARVDYLKAIGKL